MAFELTCAIAIQAIDLLAGSPQFDLQLAPGVEADRAERRPHSAPPCLSLASRRASRWQAPTMPFHSRAAAAVW